MTRSAHLVGAGRYMLHRGALVRVPRGSYGIRCELCEWSVFVPRELDYAESLRREHLGTAHLSSLTSGAAVLDPELAEHPWRCRHE